MSWATFEADMPSMQPSMHTQQLKPMVQNKPENPSYMQQLPMQMQNPQNPQNPQQQQQQKQTNQGPEVPSVQGTAKGWKDISEYEEVSDWFYIITGVLVTELVVIFLIRFFPEIFGKYANVWYNRFKLSAVIADVLIIVLGIGIARYAYTEFVYPKYDWNPLYFTITTVLIQISHDILFYLGVIQQVPKGQNAMIDVMKEYAGTSGKWAILSDSAMMVSSVGLAMIFKGMESHLTTFIGLLAVYAIPYILETRNDYTTIA